MGVYNQMHLGHSGKRNNNDNDFSTPTNKSLASSSSSSSPPSLSPSNAIELTNLDTTNTSSNTHTAMSTTSNLLHGEDYESGSEDYDQSSVSFNYPNERSKGAMDKIRLFFRKVWEGPREPRDEYAPRIQSLSYLEDLPVKFKSRVPLTYRRLMLTAYLLFWFGLCYAILVPYLTVPPSSKLNPHTHIYSLSCSASQDFWIGKNAACGMNGELCPDVTKHLASPDDDIIIRCPALCDRGSWTYSLLPIGDQRIKHRGYFIGGGDAFKNKEHKTLKSYDQNQLTNPYRADSYPCGAAVHAGLVSPFWGGCARISYKSGAQPYFNSTKGKYGVDPSISFDSFFKSSFFFKKLGISRGQTQKEQGHEQYDTFTECNDPRMIILLINVVLGLPIIYLASGAVAYWILTIVGFWTICLATDPPLNVDAVNPEDFAYLISIGLERFLPTCSILYILWHFSTKRTLSEPKLPGSLDSRPLGPEFRLQEPYLESTDQKISYMSRVLLFYPLFWLGILNNVTFDRLPVDRLTISDLKEQPGALLSVSCIIFTIATCAVIQAYKIWLSGRFRKYLFVYSIFVVGLIFLAQLPGLTLRVHHYILAMLLIPGCATRGRTALMFQGILLGLFLSGASRWGLAAIAETIASLKRDDPQGNIVPPLFTGYNNESGLLNWVDPINNGTVKRTAYQNKFTSISLLINDIEEYVSDGLASMGTTTNDPTIPPVIDIKSILTNSTSSIYNWVQDTLQNGIKDENGNIAIYLRVGRKIPNTKIYSDYSNAAVLKWPSGELVLPVPGLT
ncbi:hypothetical protein PVL30_001272 [Lodderomyces elongisporus]|uniref:uncharacterized protein n=1 Tax=Lodderomyces elongisporus TaxID=36914 RepID=UPI0029225784|nr:uncharacterized protein PVL30_001272 [Lodderomyces elongisporus]WLF77554.1 hypothetical protein PVL30_001272 [Lodderomyces elongisporus]